MTLTPLKIRGKRKPKPPVAVSSSRISSNKGDRFSNSSGNSNNYEDDAPLPPRQKPKRSLSAALAHRKTSRPRSPIEILPLEILEEILLHCRSFGLPRASHLIGAKLSGRATLFKLFFAAFHDTWSCCFGAPVDLGAEPEFDLDTRAPPRTGMGDPDFQTELLTLPWVDIDFLLEAQQVWADKFARDKPYTHWLGEGNISPNKLHDSKHPPPSSISSSSSPSSPSFKPLEPAKSKCFNAKECFEVDYQEALEWPSGITNIYNNRMQDVHPMTRIPSRLISGPWTEEQRRRLFWLVRGGAAGHTKSQYQPPWETRIAGIQNMVIRTTEPEFLVETCLMADDRTLSDGMIPWLYASLPTDVAGDEVEQISRRLEWGDDEEETKEMLHRVKGNLADSIDETFWMKSMSRGGNG